MKFHRSVAAVAVATAVLAGCGDDGPSGAIAVRATDSECIPDKTDLMAGSHTFRITNDGTEVTELYVYGNGDRIVGEVENVGPGTSRNLTVQLPGGRYELACKPGQTGDGIRAELVVQGAAGEDGDDAGHVEHGGHEKNEAYDREVEVGAREFAFSGLDDFTAEAGEAIEFKLHNAGAIQHELEIIGPDGRSVGEVPPTDGGATGEAVVKLGKPGTYRYRCGIANHADLGMRGAFTVTGS